MEGGGQLFSLKGGWPKKIDDREVKYSEGKNVMSLPRKMGSPAESPLTKSQSQSGKVKGYFSNMMLINK